MTKDEFSNEFDVLYNNITSNQAPGLDEYEKSVFLTKAQDEILKKYFDPRSNKVQEGFDGSERRQIDFSMVLKSINYTILKISIETGETGEPTETIRTLGKLLTVLEKDESGTTYLPKNYKIDTNFLEVSEGPNIQGKPQTYVVNPFMNSSFDLRENTKSVYLEEDILMIVNEYIQCTREFNIVRLTVVPINYTEYSRVMSKPFKRPLKFKAWRLIESSNRQNKSELIVGPNDSIEQYTIRYVKKPAPIVLCNLEDGLSVNGVSEASECELDSILHHEILQRAVELAKASYTGDLTSQIALGHSSQTDIGIVSQSR